MQRLLAAFPRSIPYPSAKVIQGIRPVQPRFLSAEPTDRFERSFTIIRGQLPQALQSFIEKLEREPASVNVMGWGADGNVYHTEPMPDFPQGLAVKVSHLQATNGQGQMQRQGQTFEVEANNLERLPTKLKHSQTMVAHLRTNAHHYLVTTWMPGKSPNPHTNPITPQQLKGLLNQLFQLDQAGVLHRDLKKENLLLEGEHVNLIDYGASVPFALTNGAENHETHHYPSFSPPGNIRNFEDTFLYPYLRDMAESGNTDAARGVFETYLTLRSGYHQKRTRWITQQLKAKDLPEATRHDLQKARNYEQLQAKLFQKPSAELVDLEALKIQMTYCAEEAYRHEILEKKPYANLLWKLHGLGTIRRFLKAVQTMQNQADNSAALNRFLTLQAELGQYRQSKIHQWYQGASGWVVDNLMGKHDGQSYAADMIEQLENPGIVVFTPLQDVAALLSQADGRKKTK